MRGKMKRGWQPMVGFLAVGLLAYGLSIEGAPAGDSGLSDRQSAKPQSIDGDADKGDSVSQAASALVSGGGKVGAQSSLAMDEWELESSGHFGRIVSSRMVSVARVQQQSGTVEAGGACTCDGECAVDPAPDACEVANCVEGECRLTDAPAATQCDRDGQFCTDDRCNSEGECVAGISPCPKCSIDVNVMGCPSLKKSGWGFRVARQPFVPTLVSSREALDG